VANFRLQGLICNCLKFSLAFLPKKECSITPLARILYCADFIQIPPCWFAFNKTTGLQKQSITEIDYAKAIVRERGIFFLGKIG